MKNKRLIWIAVLIFIVLTAVISAQNVEYGCCCNPVTNAGRFVTEVECSDLEHNFLSGTFPPCDQVCEEIPILPRVPVCGDGICETGEDVSCPSDCVTRELLLCGSRGYYPEPNNVLVTPLIGEKKIKITFNQECPATYVVIKRFEKDSNVGKTVAPQLRASEFVDESLLKWNTDYTYKIYSYYAVFDGKSEEIEVDVNLGDLECWIGKDVFCLNELFYSNPVVKSYLETFGHGDETSMNFMSDFDDSVEDVFYSKFNKAYYCTDDNVLEQYQDFGCSNTAVCAIKADSPVCIVKGDCSNDNLFGLFSTISSCEKTDEQEPEFCFLDNSKTIVDSCFDCVAGMDCYNYKSQTSCSRDNCGVGSCTWNPVFSLLGIGVCVDSRKSNCDFCFDSSPRDNSVFNNCSEKKATALSVLGNECFYDKDALTPEETVKTCDEVSCTDYSQLQCASPMGGISLANDNSIIDKSADVCHIGVCQYDELTGCRKNADGSKGTAWPDCVKDDAACELDYFPPWTNVIPAGVEDRTDFLNLILLDKKFAKDELKDHAAEPSYETFLCIKSANNACNDAEDYMIKVNAKRLILKNLDLKDGRAKLARLVDGENKLYFYSRDPSKNLEIIKNIEFDACDDCQGPTLLDVKITGGQLSGSNLYSSFTNPVITLIFDEPTKILSTSITNTVVDVISEPGYKTTHVLRFSGNLAEDLFRLSVDVENEKQIKADPILFFNLYIDTSLASVDIVPADGAVLSSQEVDFKLTFSKMSELKQVKLTHVKSVNDYLLNETSQDITEEFLTSDNIIYETTVSDLTAGAYKLYVDAKDYRGLSIIRETRFYIGEEGDINDFIALVKPRFGVSDTFVFTAAVETALKYDQCKYAFDLPDIPKITSSSFLAFADMSGFDGYNFETSQLSKLSIPFNDYSEHPLYVFCKKGDDFVSAMFDVYVDPYAPVMVSAYAFPDVIAEESVLGPNTYSTTLKVETDKPSFCKFSKVANNYELMENEFIGFNEHPLISHAASIFVDSIRSYTYYVACESPAGVVSETKSISFSIDLSAVLQARLASKTVFSDLDFFIGIEINKKSLCYIGEELSTLACVGECTPEYVHHQDMLVDDEGEYDYVVKCVHPLSSQSDIIDAKIIIDQTDPEMVYVNDSSILPEGNVSYFADKLRVAYLANDSLSGVAYYLVSIHKTLTDEIIVSEIKSIVLDGSYHYLENLTLENNTKYTVVVRAVDHAGLISDVLESDGVLVDASAEPYTCNNGIKDGTESDVDCGGSCPACDNGENCNVSGDCSSDLCINGVCLIQTATCTNGILDGFETDVDCGGVCDPCYDGERCDVDNDCKSDYCSPSRGRCEKTPACEDRKLSTGETDIDCGGPCWPCAEGRSCEVDVDCEAGLICLDSVCVFEEEKDTDNDGVPDNEDICPNTPSGEPVDQYGCSLSQKVSEEISEEKGFSFLTFLLILLLLSGMGIGGYLLYKKFKEKKILPKFKKPFQPSKPRPAHITYKHVTEKPKLSPADEKIERLKKFAKQHDLESGWLEVKPSAKNHKEALDKLKKSIGKIDKDIFEKLKKSSSPKSQEDLFNKLRERVEEHKKKKRK